MYRPLRSFGPMIPSESFRSSIVRTQDVDNKLCRLPVLSKSGEGLFVKDMTSAPGVPDTEILWAPVTVAGPGLEDPRSGSVGMTMVCHSLCR